MKKYILSALAAAMLPSFTACSDISFGDEFLGDHPESSGATLDTLFKSAVNADRVLTKAYTYLPYGLPTGDKPYDKLGVTVLEAITDLHYSFRNNPSDGPRNLYYSGTLSDNISTSMLQGREAYRFGSELEYYAIRYAWIYIENAGRIPDISDADRNSRIAEAKMIIAIAYAEMLRYIGGVPILDHSVSTEDEMQFPRATFSQTVEFIVQLLDEAIPYLDWTQSSTDDGRMTKAGAMALKLRVLLFAASPMFNSDEKWHPEADKYTCYGNYDRERWKRAVDAGKEFFEAWNQYGYYGLTEAQEQTPDGYRSAYRSGYFCRGETEVLISTRRGYSNATLHKDFYQERRYSGPTLNYVNMFPWSDGEDFPEDFDWENPVRQPFFENGIPTRDPRLYENVAVPGDIYYDGTFAPVYTNSLSYVSGSGFLQMKFILQNTSDREGQPAHWPYLRLPEVLLSYAEAINEYNGAPDQTAYDCVNDVRKRVGLKGLEAGMDQTEFREALLRERALEFGFEEVRWFDLIRWKREEDFTKPLYGLQSKADNHLNPQNFTFSTPVALTDRAWRINWDTKWYLLPIPRQEINKEYGLTQNPGW